MLKVNLFDQNFNHSFEQEGYYTCSMGRKPKLLEWVKNNLEFDGATVFTDNMIFDPVVDRVKSKLKIAWCLEPPSIHPHVYKHIVDFEHKFDYVFTFSQDLISRNPAKYIRTPIGSSRVNDEDIKVHPKTKGLSIIASGKNFAEGHRLRHAVIRQLEGVDCWGDGYKYFTSKLDPLRDYMFSIAIMNCRIDNYFTEVLVDCFALGTVPIFWGCPNIGDFYNTKGIIQFETIDDLRNIKLSKSLYESMHDAIEENKEIAKTMVSTDDLVAKNILKLL